MRVRIAIYDILGRQVAVPVRKVQPAGPHEVFWTARGSGGGRLAPGLYLYELRTEEAAVPRWLILQHYRIFTGSPSARIIRTFYLRHSSRLEADKNDGISDEAMSDEEMSAEGVTADGMSDDISAEGTSAARRGLFLASGRFVDKGGQHTSASFRLDAAEGDLRLNQ